MIYTDNIRYATTAFISLISKDTFHNDVVCLDVTNNIQAESCMSSSLTSVNLLTVGVG